MEKKILGYELIKEYPGSKPLGYYEKFTTGELSKFPEFWQPTYEEEFKIGDWATVIREFDKNGNQGRYNKGYVFQIDEMEKSNLYKDILLIPKNWGGILSKYCRKATAEEIKAAQKTIVKMHSSNKGEFEIEIIDGEAWYRPDNKHLPKEWIKETVDIFDDIINAADGFSPYSVAIGTLNVGCYHNTRKADWEKVYSLLK